MGYKSSYIVKLCLKTWEAKNLETKTINTDFFYWLYLNNSCHFSKYRSYKVYLESSLQKIIGRKAFVQKGRVIATEHIRELINDQSLVIMCINCCKDDHLDGEMP